MGDDLPSTGGQVTQLVAHGWQRGLSVAFVGAVALLGPRPVGAASPPTSDELAVPPQTPSPSPRARVRVHVDTSGVGAAGPILQARLDDELTQSLTEHHAVIVDDSDAPTLHFSVLEVGGETPGFELSCEVRDPGWRGPTDEKASSPLACPLCTESELVELARAQVPTMLRRAEAIADAPPKTREPTSTAPQAVDHPSGGLEPVRAELDPTRTETTPPQRRFTGLGRAGIGLGATGVATLVVGAVLATRPATPLPSDPTRERYTSTAGYATLGAGAALVLTGAALLGVDATRRARLAGAVGRHGAAARLTLSF